MHSLAQTEYAMRIAEDRAREQAATRAVLAARPARTNRVHAAPRASILARLARLHPVAR